MSSSRKRSSNPFPNLSNPNDEFFIDELKRVSINLSDENSQLFFKHILQLFERKNKITNDVGNEILLTICKLLTLRNHRNVFIENNFVSKLPLDNFLLIDNILNILDLISSKSPNSITREILEPITRRQPAKSLFLIANIIQKSINNNNNKNNKNKNNALPNWLSLLFENESFRRPECAENYVSLLVYLLENSDEFLQNYSRKVWSTICSLLLVQNENIITYAYVSLCYLIDNEVSNHSKLPFQLISQHLMRISLQKSAYSLLIRCDFRRMDSPELIKALIQQASNNRRAAMVLLRIAQTDIGAELLIKNSSWMSSSLPDKPTTMMLFCTVLLHQDLREELSKKAKDVAGFLSSAFSIEASNNNASNEQGKASNIDSVVVSVLCTILRRIPFDETFVNQLSRSRFLTAYFGKTTKQDAPRNAIYALHVIYLIAECCYTKELDLIVDFLVYTIKKNDDNSNFALVVAESLCKYEECVEKLKAKKIAKYLMDLDTTTKYQRRFLRAMGAIE